MSAYKIHLYLLLQSGLPYDKMVSTMISECFEAVHFCFLRRDIAYAPSRSPVVRIPYYNMYGRPGQGGFLRCRP